jgi:hypothetical protein
MSELRAAIASQFAEYGDIDVPATFAELRISTNKGQLGKEANA